MYNGKMDALALVLFSDFQKWLTTLNIELALEWAHFQRDSYPKP
jgi:hypothetical protein